MEARNSHGRSTGDPELTSGRLARGGLAVGLYAAGVIAVLGLAAALIAASQADASGWLRRGWHGERHERFGAHAEYAVDWVLHRIDATEEQGARVREIVALTIDDLGELHDERGDAHDRLEALLTAESVDRDALEAFRREQLARVDRAPRRLADAAAAIAAELSPEQRAGLAALARSHHHRRGGHRGHAH